MMTIIKMDAVVGRMLRRLVLRMMTITTMTIIAILTRKMMMTMMTGGAQLLTSLSRVTMTVGTSCRHLDDEEEDDQR